MNHRSRLWGLRRPRNQCTLLEMSKHIRLPFRTISRLSLLVSAALLASACSATVPGVPSAPPAASTTTTPTPSAAPSASPSSTATAIPEPSATPVAITSASPAVTLRWACIAGDYPGRDPNNCAKVPPCYLDGECPELEGPTWYLPSELEDAGLLDEACAQIAPDHDRSVRACKRDLPTWDWGEGWGTDPMNYGNGD